MNSASYYPSPKRIKIKFNVYNQMSFILWALGKIALQPRYAQLVKVIDGSKLKLIQMHSEMYRNNEWCIYVCSFQSLLNLRTLKWLNKYTVSKN